MHLGRRHPGHGAAAGRHGARAHGRRLAGGPDAREADPDPDPNPNPAPNPAPTLTPTLTLTQVGQMLVKLAKQRGVTLLNVVRRADQAQCIT